MCSEGGGGGGWGVGVFFFFQAEDGIRDHCVTGVQTCALPISEREENPGRRPPGEERPPGERPGDDPPQEEPPPEGSQGGPAEGGDGSKPLEEEFEWESW